MSTKKPSDASLTDPWFLEEEDAPDPRLRPAQPPARTRKERTTIAPLPKKT